jgi:chaperonin GroEL
MVVSEDTGAKLENIDVDVLGKADKVWTDKESTRIIGGKGDPKEIEARVAQLKSEIDSSTSDFDKEKLQERLAKLAGGVAVISVGATTEVELKEKKERVDDAVAATKAALEEGIVPGGGTTFLKARKVLGALKDQALNEEEKVGMDIVYQALAMPVEMLAKNSGVDAGWVLRQIEDNPDADYGFNAATLEFGPMLKQGVVDPTKVVRSALENAASVATMILTTEALVTDLPEKAPAAGGGMPDMNGMGGMGGMM